MKSTMTVERYRETLINAFYVLFQRYETTTTEEALDVMYESVSQELLLSDDEIAELGLEYLIPGKRWYDKAIAVAEANGWSAEYEANGFVFGRFSSAGQDFRVDVDANTPEEMIDELERFYEAYDPEREAMLWVDVLTGKGKNGAPYSLKDIIKDMEELEQSVEALLQMLKEKMADYIE